MTTRIFVRASTVLLLIVLVLSMIIDSLGLRGYYAAGVRGNIMVDIADVIGQDPFLKESCIFKGQGAPFYGGTPLEEFAYSLGQHDDLIHRGFKPYMEGSSTPKEILFWWELQKVAKYCRPFGGTPT